MSDEKPPEPPPMNLSDEEVDILAANGRGVPSDRAAARIRTLASERAKLRKEFDAAQAELDTFRKGKAEFDTQRKAWEDERVTTNETWALRAAGVTDEEGVDIARHLFSKLPAEGKPKSLTDWINSFTAEKPAPKALQPYLPTADGKGDTKPKAPPPKAGNPPNTAKPPTEVDNDEMIELTRRARAGDTVARAKLRELLAKG